MSGEGSREGCEDEATEGKVELLLGGGSGDGIDVEELSIGMCKAFVGGFGVRRITVLPKSKACRVGHLQFGLLGEFAKSGTIGTLLRRDLFGIPMQGVVADDVSAIAVGYIELTIASKSAVEIV